MRVIIISFFAFLFIVQSYAQQEEFNMVGVSYTINPAVGLKDPSNEQLREVDMDLSEFRAFVMLPFRLNNQKTTLLAGADYTFVGGPLDNLPSDKKVDANLHAIRFTAGINQKLGNKWAFRALLMPTIASDFSGNLSSEAFTLQASAVIKRVMESGFHFGLGAAYTNGFGEPKTVPVVELGYRSEKFDLIIIGPIQAAFRYHFKDMFVGFRVDLQGNEYALSIDEGGNNLSQVQSVKFSRYNIGPTVAWNISNSTRLQLSGGISVKRKLTATDIDNISYDYGLENGAFVKAGIFFGSFKRS